jgi:hypothetical protein
VLLASCFEFLNSIILFLDYSTLAFDHFVHLRYLSTKLLVALTDLLTDYGLAVVTASCYW